ncbi:putative holin [Ectopseudomonas toyotomiensis]|nr:putative holin [Pseudomonas toyotomiensis]SFQ51396.1 Putative 2/3 transmembrane domain holin [Pseudomonas toyotomiensis]
MATTCQNKPKRRLLPRMTVFAVISILLLVAIWYVRPEQLQVVLYKASLITIGAVLGYYIDRALFLVEARPHQCIGGIHIVGAWLRRALIVLACVLGMTLGL